MADLNSEPQKIVIEVMPKQIYHVSDQYFTKNYLRVPKGVAFG
jgi:hypothetical protein